MKIIGYITTTIFLLVINCIAQGFVYSKLWLWFVTPVFGVPTPPLAILIGFLFTIRFALISGSDDDSKKSWTEILLKAAVSILFVPPLTLFGGWIIHLFI